MKVTSGMRKVLKAIDAGQSHRASWNTYEALTVSRLAEYVSGKGWTLLPAGSELLVKARKDSHGNPQELETD